MHLKEKLDNLKVLVVEDSEDDCQFLLHYLRKQGFNISHLRIQTEIEMLEALMQPWDIILSDYSMPKFSGPRAFEVLKNSGLDIPFIIISGTVGEDVAVEIMRSGISDYILKSNLSRLGPAVRRELEAAHDRAHHKQTEKMLSHTEEQLRQSQKMEAIGQLAGGIAHDFNNMLSVMQIYCHKIKQAEDVQQIRNYVDKILSVHSRSVALTKQLLIFSRKQPTSLAKVQLGSTVLHMQDMLQSLIGSQIVLDVEAAENQKDIFANQSQIEQVIMNLIVNARDAMPEGGQILLKTYSEKLDQAKRLKSAEIAAGEYIVLDLRDHGSGISEQNLDRIFEPFFTTKPAGTGTGLGLSIIYGIVHQYCGGIDVTSQLGKGTNFKIYFPVAKPEISAPTQGTEIKTSPEKNQTILLVEDEEELRSLISEILTQDGFKILEAANGEEAISLLKQFSQKIDLIITDMVMPKMDGAELYKQIQSLYQDIPFIYISGFFKENVPDNLPFLEKPFSNRALLEKVHGVFAR